MLDRMLLACSAGLPEPDGATLKARLIAFLPPVPAPGKLAGEFGCLTSGVPSDDITLPSQLPLRPLGLFAAPFGAQPFVAFVSGDARPVAVPVEQRVEPQGEHRLRFRIFCPSQVVDDVRCVADGG